MSAMIIEYYPVEDGTVMLGGGDHDYMPHGKNVDFDDGWWIDDNQWNDEDQVMLGGGDHDNWMGYDDQVMLGEDGHGTWNPDMWMEDDYYYDYDYDMP